MPTPKPRPSTNRPTTNRPTTNRSHSRPAAKSGGAPAAARPKTVRPGSSGGVGPRTADLSGGAKKRPQSSPGAASHAVLNPDDPGVKRRAAKKRDARRKNILVWSVFAVVSVILTGMTLGVWNGKGRYLDSKDRLASKEATLRDLKVQLENAKRRFSAMTSETGKHRTLVENGFLRDDERLLLFPRDNNEQNKP